MFAAGGKD